MSSKDIGRPLYAAILAGGVGTRLWPSSRRSRPKQFADPTGSGTTMIQATADRLDGLVAPDRILVVTGDQYAQLVKQQLPFLSQRQLILEPAGRNTGPAVGLAAFKTHRMHPDAIIAFMHSDHIIPDRAAFQTALSCAVHAAQEGYIATLGIQPTSPHTGYGYIERGQELSSVSATCPLPVYAVTQFLEKPSRELAESFIAGGAHYWNGGIFVSRVDRLLEEYERQLPDLYNILKSIDDLTSSNLSSNEVRIEFENTWRSVSSVAFDIGIMEGAERVAVVPLDAGWNDIGSWNALEDVLSRDNDANLIVRGELVSVDSGDNIVSSDGALVTLIGVHDMVIVNTGDALLVGRKDQMQRVRDLVEKLAEEGHGNLL